MSDPADHLALALDVDDLVVGLRMAKRLKPWFSVAKVGLELYAAVGPDAVSALVDEGYRVFVDLKLHDIPTTVRRAARVLGVIGVGLATAHCAGGGPMLEAAAEGIAEGASSVGGPPPKMLGVTVLTSEPDVAPELLVARAGLARAAGCGGVVCAARDLDTVVPAVAGLLTVVPGIRLPGGTTHDQARPARPAEAIAAGADLLVVGRAVTAAEDPEVAAETITAAVRGALVRRSE